MTPTDAYHQFHNFQMNREAAWAPVIRKVLDAQVTQFVNHYSNGISNALASISSIPMFKTVKDIRIDGALVYGAKVQAYLPKVPKRKPAALPKDHDNRAFKIAYTALELKTRPTMGFNERMIALVNAYFEGEILADSEGITDTTREEIQRILIEANQQGKGITWMVQQMEDLNRNRALLIARTETVTGANSGAFIAALDVGLLMKKQWLATNDERTRIYHVIASGQTVNVTDYFNVGISTMLYPGDRTQENGLATPASEVCNCRCTCLYQPVRIDGRLVPFDYSQFRGLVLA